MQFEKINLDKKWCKVEVAVHQRPKCASEATARINGEKGDKGISLNGRATALALECGFENNLLDLHRCGNEFAVTIGESFQMRFYQRSNKYEQRYALINPKDVCTTMYNVTKCQVFRVRREGYYLVFSPAYDLHVERED